MAKPRRIKPFVSGAFHLLRLLWKSGEKSEAIDILALKEISWRYVTSEDAPVRSLPQRENAGAKYQAESF